MKKRFFAIMCALLVSIGCASCSGNTDSPAETTSPKESVKAPDTEAQTEAQTEAEPQIKFSEETMDGKNVYRVARVEKKADIDWTKVTAAAIDKYGWLECTEYKAYAQLVYAEDFGFVCRMTCEESNPIATYKNFDDPVCLDSCMEFFVSIDGNKYLNLEANSIGTKCMGFGKGRSGRVTVKRKIKEGFPAIPQVDDGVWTLTYELSVDDLMLFYTDIDASIFVPGFTFSGNFYKTGGKDITGNEHYGMWNEIKTEGPDFHQPSQFGTFILE